MIGDKGRHSANLEKLRNVLSSVYVDFVKLDVLQFVIVRVLFKDGRDGLNAKESEYEVEMTVRLTLQGPHHVAQKSNTDGSGRAI